MLTNVVLPNMGFGMEEGRLISWLKQPGDQVRKGEAIAELESDKATVELEATVDGVLIEQLYPADTVISVGAVLARIETEPGAQPVAAPAATPESASAPAADSEKDRQRITPLARRMMEAHGLQAADLKGLGPGGTINQASVQAALDQALAPAQSGNGRALAAPAVKKLARDKGLDLRSVIGSGPDGRVTRADVESALRAGSKPVSAAPGPITQVAATVSPSASDGERVQIQLSRMRQTIATRLSQSAQEAPHVYFTAELDFTPAVRSLPAEVGINVLILYLTVQTLKHYPALNATFEHGQLYQYRPVNLAIAVALPDGLISPVLHHADDYSLSGLAERVRDLIGRARTNKLKPQELSGGTFTVSNLGMVKQIDRFTAIINPPQVGILAVGAAKERPYVIDGGLHIRTTAHLTLSVDHRVVDGMVAAQFMEQFDKRLGAFSG